MAHRQRIVLARPDGLDDIDRQILVLLQEDGRLANADIAERVGLSPSAALGRLRRLTESGVIKGFTAILDEGRVGQPTTAYLFVTLTRHRRRLAETFLKKVHALSAITECYHITGKADYLIRVVCKDIPDYRALLMNHIVTMPEVQSLETMFVLQTEKRDTRLPIRMEPRRSRPRPGRKE